MRSKISFVPSVVESATVTAEEKKESFVHEKAAEIIDRLLSTKRKNILYHLEKCESPIEQLLLLALEEEYESFNFPVGWRIKELQEQVSIGPYRVDVLLEVACIENSEWVTKIKVVIECDGHNYHERTKEQAVRDRSRDRFLQKEGYAVLRFTGSEIWANPNKCAKEVLDFTLTEVQRYKKVQ